MNCTPFLQAVVNNAGQTYCAWLPLGNQAPQSFPWWLVFVLIMIVIFSIGASRHEAKRDEAAEIMQIKSGYWSRMQDELWRIKAGTGSWEVHDAIRAELETFEATLEIAPGEGAYLKYK